MLANRLNVLLAERQLSIKQVVEDLGISRSSISNIVNNPKANISTDTIDKLCNYLGVTPTDFFIYAPYEFNFKIAKETFDRQTLDKQVSLHLYVTATINSIESIFNYELYANLYTFDANGDDIQTGDYDLYLTLTGDSSEDEMLLPIYKKLPVAFQTETNSILCNKIYSIIEQYGDSLYVSGEGGTFDELASNSSEDYLTIAILLPWKRLKRKYDTKKMKFID